MIDCVTLNPALDITYQVDAMRVGDTNRVRAVSERPGGKGVNVARYLCALGCEVSVSGFLGGGIGERVRHLLSEMEPTIKQNWTMIQDESRRTVAVTTDGCATLFCEAGPVVSRREQERLVESFEATEAGTMVISGSLPKGLCDRYLGSVVRTVREAGKSVIVDVSGGALLDAAQAEADVLKPNMSELKEQTGAHDAREGAMRLLDLGAKAVLVSLGAGGLKLFVGTGGGSSWWARLPQPVVGNPTGAGDAVVAALAQHLDDRAPHAELAGVLADSLLDATVYSAASVLSDVAGEFDGQAASRFRESVVISEEVF